MSFFDSIPKPPPPEPERRERLAWMYPEAVIPATVPVDVVLIRTDKVAVAVGSVRAYPTGFEFTVHIGRREVTDEFGPGGDPFSRRGRGASAPEDALRLGVLYADGRRTATTSAHPHPRDEGEDQMRLTHRGGGGSARQFNQQFWLYPLPPAGPVTLVASWLEYGVPEVTAELDGAAIRAAAERAVVLWPEQPDSGSRSSWNSQTITASSRADDRPASEE